MMSEARSSAWFASVFPASGHSDSSLNNHGPVAPDTLDLQMLPNSLCMHVLLSRHRGMLGVGEDIDFCICDREICGVLDKICYRSSVAQSWWECDLEKAGRDRGINT